ncbi:hypothetical protein NQ315_004322 [Exocentrus adspersus]|uniref:Uncharacterized protein n=1 Tax=Exocentrus adspersus TaxID=1586481 RepID=A0AAV8W7L6_9CUCU|nr:hypothetical protein NQ315_004322 [Exocentrus adspersus]
MSEWDRWSRLVHTPGNKSNELLSLDERNLNLVASNENLSYLFELAEFLCFRFTLGGCLPFAGGPVSYVAVAVGSPSPPDYPPPHRVVGDGSVSSTTAPRNIRRVRSAAPAPAVPTPFTVEPGHKILFWIYVPRALWRKWDIDSNQSQDHPLQVLEL